MAAKRYVEVVIPELFDIYFNVLTHFHMIFHAEFISVKINLTSKVSLKNKSKMTAFKVSLGAGILSSVFVIHISFYKLNLLITSNY